MTHIRWGILEPTADSGASGGVPDSHGEKEGLPSSTPAPSGFAGHASGGCCGGAQRHGAALGIEPAVSGHTRRAPNCAQAA
ncbi:MAG: hypothetical protein EGQ70_09185 [Faecalibacterium prausnitzii]|nr:hypothetical protein [Faecalibacterium prausnitzii]